MKNVKRVFSLLCVAVALMSIAILSGCEKPETSISSESDGFVLSQLEQQGVIKDVQILKELRWMKDSYEITQEQYQFILKNGAPIASGEESSWYKSAYYIDDAIIPREYVQSEMNKRLYNKQARHRRHDNMDNGGAISVRVHPNVPAPWKTAMIEAASYWNAAGYNVSFGVYSAANYTQVAGEIDVVYGSAGLASNHYAGTIKPASANAVGEEIKVNSAYVLPAGYTQVDPIAKKFAMMHELGHALGLRHTDTTEGQNVSLSITCNGNAGWTDSGSIMKSVMYPNQSTAVFTDCDRAVIDWYWGNIA